MSPRLSPSELFLRAQTDERLAALAAEGHGRAFAVLIERHRRPLMGHARRLVGPERDEDVVQQALLRAWRALEGGAEIRHVQAWLHRIVHNTALTEIERQVPASEPLADDLIDPRSADLAAEQRLTVREVLAGVSTLPERQRLALLGTELEGRSRRQLAAELGLTEGAIRQLVYRARDGVRSALAAFVPLPLVTRVMRASGWLPGTGGSAALRPVGETAAASGLATGAIIKAAGTAVLAIGAVGGLVLHDVHGHRHAHHPATHRGTVSRAARSAERPRVQDRGVIATAMRAVPARTTVAVIAHPVVPAVSRSPASAGAPASVTAQPQTSIPSRRTERTGGSGSGSGDSHRPSQGASDSSGGGSSPTRSGAGTGGDTATSSSGDKQSSSGDAAASSGGGQTSSTTGSPTSSSDSATAASTGSQPDSTSTSGSSDTSSSQPPPGGSSSTGTTTSPSGGD